MADEAKKEEDDQNLRRAMYTTAGGWSTGVAFADHLSAAAPALAAGNGTVCCVHRGARQYDGRVLPIRWTSFTPSAVQPFVAALEAARGELAEPDKASDAELTRWSAKVNRAVEALEAARKWTPDTEFTFPLQPGEREKESPPWEKAYADRPLISEETPALAYYGGYWHMVVSRSQWSRDGSYWTRWVGLYYLVGEAKDGTIAWQEIDWLTRSSHRENRMFLAPALAALDGKLHLLYLDTGTDVDPARLVHEVVTDIHHGWKAAVANGKALTTPPIDESRITDMEDEEEAGAEANLSLAAHDGKLHLVHRLTGTKDALAHAVFDGTTWSDKGTLPATHRSSRTAALASYDGKLHAVYPAAGSSKLRHAIYTEARGWDKGTDLDGHDSDNTPALVVLREGPDKAPREGLLLVHRGIDRWEPSDPPAPPKPPQVVSRGTTVYSPLTTDYGTAGWCRVRHRVSMTPAVLDNGRKALILRWDANAEYFWGVSWYDERPVFNSPSRAFVTGYTWLNGPDGQILDTPGFSGSFNDSGRYFAEHVIHDPAPGTYTFALSGKTEKTRGYWTDPYDGHNDSTFYARVTCSATRAKLTV
ncbi:hypothetical protein [Streptomyces sp. NBC_00691]|uniref:hypothetical protein n=1 Tax=Streptomyces sp. NBC_00691 TaxID=2903671 RepID=UPI002E30105E|nr:hypothetical protein [Streptomyces sp. NBC_00691]